MIYSGINPDFSEIKEPEIIVDDEAADLVSSEVEWWSDYSNR